MHYLLFILMILGLSFPVLAQRAEQSPQPSSAGTKPSLEVEPPCDLEKATHVPEFN